MAGTATGLSNPVGVRCRSDSKSGPHLFDWGPFAIAASIGASKMMTGYPLLPCCVDDAGRAAAKRAFGRRQEIPMPIPIKFASR